MSKSVGERPAISVANLRVSYGEREILHGISFDVQRAETLVVLGGSGSGKSTLLRALVGLERPSGGEVWIKGVNIAQASDYELDEIRKKMGVSFQGGALFGSMTVGEMWPCRCTNTLGSKNPPSRSWCGSNWSKWAWRASRTTCPPN